MDAEPAAHMDVLAAVPKTRISRSARPSPTIDVPTVIALGRQAIASSALSGTASHSGR